MRIILLFVSWITTIYFAIELVGRQKLPYENGRYYDYDSGIVIIEQSIIFFTILTLLLFVTSSYLTLKVLENRK
jgi:hypothetical protein